MRFLSMALALLIAQFCIFADIEVNAASTGLFSQPVWQDSDRNHRRSPPQIINQLTPPQVRAGGNLPLASDAQSERQAKTRNMLSGAAAPLLKPGELPMLEEGDWRLKILPAAITRGENVLLGEIATLRFLWTSVFSLEELTTHSEALPAPALSITFAHIRFTLSEALF